MQRERKRESQREREKRGGGGGGGRRHTRTHKARRRWIDSLNIDKTSYRETPGKWFTVKTFSISSSSRGL